MALEQARWHNPAARQTLLLWEALNTSEPKLRDFVRGTAAVAYGLIDDFFDAEQIVSGIENAEGRQWPLWNLSRFLAAQGKVSEAIALAENEKDAYPKAYAFLGTAQGILDQAEAAKDTAMVGSFGRATWFLALHPVTLSVPGVVSVDAAHCRTRLDFRRSGDRLHFQIGKPENFFLVPPRFHLVTRVVRTVTICTLRSALFLSPVTIWRNAPEDAPKCPKGTECLKRLNF